MKLFLILCLSIALSACGKTDNTGSNDNVPEGNAASEVAEKLDLQKLPATVTVLLELDPSVDKGSDAFGQFISDGQDVTVGISSAVANAGGVNINEEFQGKVKITISEEHEASRELYRIYSITSIEKI